MLRKKTIKFFISICLATVLCISGVNFGSIASKNKGSNASASSSGMSDVIWEQLSPRSSVILTGNTAGNWNVILKPDHIYLFEVWGAQGGAGSAGGGGGGAAGKGSFASGFYDMRGKTANVTATAFSGTQGAGGGGAVGSSNLPGAPSQYSGLKGIATSGGCCNRGGGAPGGSGGGASGVHIGSTPLIIAGGGGGGGGGAQSDRQNFPLRGGDGGGATGSNGASGNTGRYNMIGGRGATQTSNGANGTGGYDPSGGGGGGGGGGYKNGFWGGSGQRASHSTGDKYRSPGGGGSAGAFYTGGVQSISGNSISTAWAQKSGDGMVRITEFIYKFQVVAPNSRSEQFITSQSSESDVLPKGEFTFTMTLDESRTQASVPTITVNNAKVSAGTKKFENGKYVITYRIYDVVGPITPEDYTIADLPINKYDVASPTSNTDFIGGGYVFSAPSQNIVNHGNGYTFTLTLNESHSDSSPIVKLKQFGNITQVENSGNVYTYTVSNVKGFITAADFDVNIPVNKYSLVFDPNGGMHDPDFDGFIEDIEYGNKIEEEIPDPTRTGYAFHGWWESPDNGSTLSREWDFENDEYTIEITLYAKWIPYDFHLVYKNEGAETFIGTYPGGNGNMPAIHTYETNATVLENPTRNGYTFGGWFLNGVQLDNNTLSASYLPENPAHDMTIVIHARWNVNTYYITYDNIHGTTYGSSEPHAFNLEWFDVYPTEFTVESNDILLPAPSRHGWDFKGWRATKDGTGSITQISSGRFTNITVYAEWEEWEYEILIQRYDPASPNNTPTVTIKYTELSYNLSDLNLGDTADWLFKGWVYLSDVPIENSTLHEDNFNTMIEDGKVVRKTTVVAKWHSKVMNIKFRTYVYGGTFDGYDNVDKSHPDYHEVSISVMHYESIPFIFDPVLTIYNINGKNVNGYYFSHWEYQDANNNYVYFNPTTDRVMANVTLHAYWILNTDSVRNMMTILNNIEFFDVFPPYDQIKLNALTSLMNKAEQMLTTGYVGGNKQYPDDVGRMTLDLITALDALLDDSELLAKIDALAYLEMLVSNLINMLSLSEFSDHFDDIDRLAAEVLQFMERHISTFTLEEISEMTQKVIDFFESLGITIGEGGQPDLPLNPPNQQLIYGLNQKFEELKFYEEHSNNIRLTDALKIQLADNMSQTRQLLEKINKTDAELENMLYTLTQFEIVIKTYMLTLANTEQLEMLQGLIITLTAYANDTELWAFIGNYHKESLQTVLASATSTTNGYNDPKLSTLHAQNLIGQLELIKADIDLSKKNATLIALRNYIEAVREHINGMPECENKTLLTEACEAADEKVNTSSTIDELETALSDLKSAFEAYKNPEQITPEDPNKPNPNIYVILAVVVSLLAVGIIAGFIVVKKRKNRISKLNDELQ